jgi:hypothetical protein
MNGLNALDVSDENFAKVNALLSALKERALLPLPKIELPAGWRVLRSSECSLWAYNPARDLKVGVSEAIEKDGRRWRHVSASKPKRVPNYEEMCLVKNIFVGDEVEAYQVGAPKSRHVSIHPNCLHWWAPMDGPVLPDFSCGGIAI